VLGRTIHGMPQIGELSPGIWLASGFGGHGFNTTAMAGNLIARAIVDGDDTWRLFVPFELIWAGGLTGRVAAQVGYWWSRRRDKVNAQKARGREAAGHQAAPARRSASTKKRADRAPPPRASFDAPSVAAMELPAVDLPAEPELDQPASRMAEPGAAAGEEPREPDSGFRVSR
jgi:gamma-glutamylputrescine oxidase